MSRSVTPSRVVPEPGIYENVPFAEYLAWDCISNSRLGPAERSLLHFHQQEPVEETPAMRLGTLCHVGRLEPAALYRRYAVMPDFTVGLTNEEGKPYSNPKATTAYKRRAAEFLAQHADQTIVTQEEWDVLVGVVGALDRDALAHRWFTAEGPVEVSLVWNDPDTGLRCKGRIDKWARHLGIVVDLKTCRDCLRFPHQMAERRYHRQGAMYLMGLEVLTGELFRFGLVAVETAAPFGIMAAPVREEDMLRGRREVQRLLRDVAAAKAANAWPGYTSPAEWSLPAWATKDDAIEPLTLTIAGRQVTL